MRKAQAAVMGILVTVVILTLTISLFYSQITNFFSGGVTYEEIKSEADNVGNILLSPGFPENWDESSVKKVGLLDGPRVSRDKLERFANLNYSRAKLMLGSKYDFMFYIEKDGEKVIPPGIYRNFFGWNGYIESLPGNGGFPFEHFFNFVNSQANHIAKTEKFIYLDNDIADRPDAKLVVYTWDTANLEIDETECNDGIDNDQDLIVDYNGDSSLNDPGCDSVFDDNETDPPFDDSSFQCRISSDVCEFNETEVMTFNEPFNPFDIFGQLHSFIGLNPPKRLCCYYVNYIGADCSPANSVTILNIGKGNHVQQGNLADYIAGKVCVYGKIKNLSCSCSNSCGSSEGCAITLSDLNNGHMKSCDSGFDNKICCEYTDGPAQFSCP